jgi:hypothetical protein
MRSFTILLLSLAVAIALPNRPTTQSPPKLPTPPQPQPSGCYELRAVDLGFPNRWARILTGDEWITGCVGPAGKCYFAVWIPC